MSDPVLDSQDIRRKRGSALKAARQAAGLSARKLVDRVNDRTAGSDLTDHAIYAYEAGRVLLSREVAQRVAAILKMPVGELLLGDPDFRPAPTRPQTHAPGPDNPGRLGALGAMNPGDEPDAGPTSIQTVEIDPQELHHLLAVRASVLARCGQLIPAVDTLIRQLERPRFSVPTPMIFEAGFELCSADLRGLLDAPEAGWIQRQDDDALHSPLRHLLAHADDLAHQLTAGYQALKEQTRTHHDCAPGCLALAAPLRDVLDQITDEAGRVRRLAPHR